MNTDIHGGSGLSANFAEHSSTCVNNFNMDPPTFEFTEAERKNTGLLGDGVSEFAAQAVATMKEHPELLKLSPFHSRVYELQGPPTQGPWLARLPDPKRRVSSNLSGLTLASDATVVSQYTPDEYERTSYYNSITGDRDHPELVYCSDFLT